LAILPSEEDAFVIGGGEIYQQTLPFVDKIELTRVHFNFDADTFFPVINPNEWDLIEKEYHPKDDKHLYDFTYETYLRRL